MAGAWFSLSDSIDDGDFGNQGVTVTNLFLQQRIIATRFLRHQRAMIVNLVLWFPREALQSVVIQSATATLAIRVVTATNLLLQQRISVTSCLQQARAIIVNLVLWFSNETLQSVAIQSRTPFLAIRVVINFLQQQVGGSAHTW